MIKFVKYLVETFVYSFEIKFQIVLILVYSLITKMFLCKLFLEIVNL